MLLTNLTRFRYHIGGDGNNPLSDSVSNKRMIQIWMSSVSKSIEKYLDRKLEKKERNEYFSSDFQTMKFFPSAYPIDTSENYNIYYDSEGLWETSGGEGEIEDIYPSNNNRIINLPYRAGIENERGIKFTYTGGLANYGTKGIYSVDSFSPATGNYVYGDSSGAIGEIIGWDSVNNRLTVENNFGSFEEEETLIEYSDEDLSSATGETTTLNSFYKSALTDVASDICLACDIEMSHKYRMINNFEAKGVDENGVSFQKKDYRRTLPFQPETINLLQPYVRKTF
jgi:hypothetical protein